MGAKFAVSWRTHSEHAVLVDNDVSVGNLVSSSYLVVFGRTYREHDVFDNDMNLGNLDISPFSEILATQCFFMS